MVNFVYLVGDRETGEAVIVDPAYGIDDLLGILAADGMRCVGALATHFHPDHVGGELMGWGIEGITRPARGGPGARPRPGRRGPLGRASTGVGAGDLVAPRRGRHRARGRHPRDAGAHPRATPRAASASWSTAN